MQEIGGEGPGGGRQIIRYDKLFSFCCIISNFDIRNQLKIKLVTKTGYALQQATSSYLILFSCLHLVYFRHIVQALHSQPCQE